MRMRGRAEGWASSWMLALRSCFPRARARGRAPAWMPLGGESLWEVFPRPRLRTVNPSRPGSTLPCDRGKSGAAGAVVLRITGEAACHFVHPRAGPVRDACRETVPPPQSGVEPTLAPFVSSVPNPQVGLSSRRPRRYQ
jgi:hypothetical protein